MIAESELCGIEKDLVSKLREMRNNDDFIIWCRACLKNDEERKWVLEAINSGEVKDADEVSDYALQIHEDRGAQDG